MGGDADGFAKPVGSYHMVRLKRVSKAASEWELAQSIVTNHLGQQED